MSNVTVNPALEYDSLYLSFIKVLVHAASAVRPRPRRRTETTRRPHGPMLLKIPKDIVYLEQVVKPSVQRVLNHLASTGVISNYAIAHTGDNIVVQIQETLPFDYLVYTYSINMFNDSILAVAEIMVT
jgi:hypothetical protein